MTTLTSSDVEACGTCFGLIPAAADLKQKHFDWHKEQREQAYRDYLATLSAARLERSLGRV